MGEVKEAARMEVAAVVMDMIHLAVVVVVVVAHRVRWRAEEVQEAEVDSGEEVAGDHSSEVAEAEVVLSHSMVNDHEGHFYSA